MKNYYIPHNYEGVYRPYVNDVRAGASAFRAINNVDIPLQANSANKVRFQTEQYDLANEYDLNTSTFVPEKVEYIPFHPQLNLNLLIVAHIT
ncbi:hypothetical protein ACSS31_29530 (plasmid) [Priestia megaterium]